MITSDSCGACATMKEYLSNQIDGGRVEVKRVEDEEGRKLADSLGVQYVPTFLCMDSGDPEEMEDAEVADMIKKGDKPPAEQENSAENPSSEAAAGGEATNEKGLQPAPRNAFGAPIGQAGRAGTPIIQRTSPSRDEPI